MNKRFGNLVACLLVVLLSGVIPVGLALAEEEAQTIKLVIERVSPAGVSFDVASGESFSVTFRVKNSNTAGDANRTNYYDYELTYSGLTFVSAGSSPTSGSGWLAPGASTTYTYNFTAPTGPATGSITLSASVTSISPHRTWPSGGDQTSDSKSYTVNVLAPPDTTPPETWITAGPTGWINTTSATFAWIGSDNVTPTPNLVYSWRLDGGSWSGYSSATTVTLSGLTEGAHTFEVRAKDGAGNVDPTPASQGFSVDITPPSISASATANGSPYPAGTWTNQDVTVHFTCDDPGGSGVASCPADVIVSAEGETSSVSGTATDNAGNSASASFGPIKIDKTPPVVTITVPAYRACYLLNQVVLANWSATDSLSGIASASGTVPSGSPIDTSTVGPKTFQVNATDNAGNVTQIGASGTYTYCVCYAFGGILQPINADGSSIFKLGSTVPVKFQLRDASGAFVTNAVARIYLLKISNGVNGTEVEAVSTSAATTGNLFRYDFTSNQYIFNLGTKGLSTGTWQIRIELDDGTSQYVRISLR